MTDDNIARILEICAEKLTVLFEGVRLKEGTDGDLPFPPTSISQAVLPSHNVRVRLQPAHFEADDGDG